MICWNEISFNDFRCQIAETYFLTRGPLIKQQKLLYRKTYPAFIIENFPDNEIRWLNDAILLRLN